MRVIFARAATRYEGRISAELSLGDVLIVIRDVDSGGDGSALVFDCSKGLQPRNWAPAGSVLVETPESLMFTHESRGEVLEIYLAEIHWQAHDDGVPLLAGELLKLGAEREVSDLIAEQLDCVDADLELIGREVRTSAGPMDLLCRHTKTGQLVIIEVKRKKSTLNDCYQLLRYRSALNDPVSPLKLGLTVGDQPILGVLVSPSLAKNAKAFIDADPHLEFRRVSYEQLR